MAMLRTFYSACALLLCMVVLTGVAYPVLITGIAQVAFPHQADGSLIIKEGKVMGSELLGQSFTSPEYFWGRPSATTPAYNAAASSASNWSPANSFLHQAVKERIKQLQKADPKNAARIPVDLLTASASGLDPHISAAAAEYQIARVARHRKIPEQQVRDLVNSYTESEFLGYSPARVNVLLLNLGLDEAR